MRSCICPSYVRWDRSDSLHNNSARHNDIQNTFALVTMTTSSRFDTPILVSYYGIKCAAGT